MLSDLIAQVIAAKTGNKEFALFYTGDGWEAHVGNPTNCVCLGEVPGDISAGGDSAEEAVTRLLAAVQG